MYDIFYYKEIAETWRALAKMYLNQVVRLKKKIKWYNKELKRLARELDTQRKK